MQLRIDRDTFRQFLVDHLKDGLASEMGRVFLSRFYPGLQDPDISEETCVSRAAELIEDRYVQPEA